LKRRGSLPSAIMVAVMVRAKEKSGVAVKRAINLIACLIVVASPLNAQTSGVTGQAYQYGAGRAIREKCQSCTITLVTREVLSGELYHVTHDSLGVITTRRVGKSPFGGDAYGSFKEMVPLGAVSSVKCGDPVWDGALKGFAAGGIPLALFGALISEGLKEPGYTYDDDATLEMAAIGLGIGGTTGLLLGLFLDSVNGSREKEIVKERLVREWTGY